MPFDSECQYHLCLFYTIFFNFFYSKYMFLMDSDYCLAFCARITGLFASPPQNYFQFSVLFNMSYFLEATTRTLLHRLLLFRQNRIWCSLMFHCFVWHLSISEECILGYIVHYLGSCYWATYQLLLHNLFCKQTDNGSVDDPVIRLNGMQLLIRKPTRMPFSSSIALSWCFSSTAAAAVTGLGCCWSETETSYFKWLNHKIFLK